MPITTRIHGQVAFSGVTIMMCQVTSHGLGKKALWIVRRPHKICFDSTTSTAFEMSSENDWQPLIAWGPGMSIVLRRLPRIILPPAFAVVLATLGLEHLEVLKVHNVGRSTLAITLWILYKLASQSVASFRLRQARHQFGLDVIDIPIVKLKWPGNVDFISLAAEARDRGYASVTDVFTPFVQSHGNIYNLPLFGQDFIFTIEPEHIKTILSTDAANFIKGEANHEKMYTLLGEGVFNVDGDMWKFHRSMTRPYFSRERVIHFEMFARHSDAAISKLLSRLAETSSDGTPLAVDFQELVSRFTMDSASEFLFGQNVRSIDEPLAYPHASIETTQGLGTGFAAAFGRVQAQTVIRYAYGPMWPYFEMFWDRTGKDMRVIDAFVKPIVHAKLEQKKRGGPEKGAGDEEDAETLIDHLVQLTNNEKLIKDELFNIFVAGRDTTATTLTFTCYMLAIHPEVLAKLRAEIISTVGATEYPTFDDFREMKYMRAVINEVLRLFPPVPGNQRECVKSTVLKSGGKQHYVPAGVSVVYSVLFMHTRKDIWGPDADSFDPERWLDERHKKYFLTNPFIFLPFNAGPRICLGQQFAYNETSFFLTRLLQRVDQISLAPDAQPTESHPPAEWAGAPGRKGIEKIWPKSHLTMHSFGGLWVRMKEASS